MLNVARLLVIAGAFVIVAGIVALVVALASKSKAEPSVETEDRSYFDGGYWAFIGYSLLVGLVVTITLGIATPWMICMLQRWKAKHTVVNGKRMYFDGTGLQLIGRFILWWFLTLITFGIYGLWMSIAIQKWVCKHTHFAGEEDNNSYFDGGVLGLLGTGLLVFLVTFVPVVGVVWGTIISTRWVKSHTVIDSRRLVFTGKVGTFFLKYLLWGFLTAITFGIFGLFVPVKAMRLEAEYTIDHEHTPEALLQQSEYRNVIRTDSASYKSYRVEDEMEGIKAGITDTTEKEALLTLAEGGQRSAQYLYAVRYAEEKYTEEPFSSMLKASAEAEYAPAMSLYALTHNLEGGSELLEKAAEKGQLPAIHNRLVFYANAGLSIGTKDALPMLKKAVRCGDLLAESDEALGEEEQELLKKCTLAIRRIESSLVKKKSGAGMIAAIVIAAVVVFMLLLGAISMFLFRGVPVMDTRPNTMADGYSSSYDEPAAVPATQSGGLFG